MAGNSDWSVSAIEILKYEINDPSGIVFSPEEYQRRIYNSAFTVSAELVNYTVQYTVDNIGLNIDPDPEISINGARDSLFIVLSALKAACSIWNERLYDDAGNAVRVHDGDSDIDTSLRAKARQTAMDSKWSPCNKYYELLNRVSLSYSTGNGTFVVGNEWYPGGAGRWTTINEYLSYINDVYKAKYYR